MSQSLNALMLEVVRGHRGYGSRMSNGRYPSLKPFWILHEEQRQAKARAQAEAKASKQALCRERMSMWLEDPVQQRFDKEDHQGHVDWL